MKMTTYTKWYEEKDMLMKVVGDKLVPFTIGQSVDFTGICLNNVGVQVPTNLNIAHCD